MLKYLKATSDKARAVELYKYNILISQAMYPLISILEVGLRNSMDKALKEKLGENWIVEGKDGFMNDTDMTYFDEREGVKKPDTTLRDKVIKVEARLKHDGIPVVHNKVVGDIGLGFWVKLMDAKPISILKAQQLRAFKNRSGKIQISYSQLNDIRVLRNRISHQEPICFDKSGKLCIDTIKLQYRTVKDAIGWIDNELLKWSDNFDSARKVIAEINDNIIQPNKATPVRFSPSFLAKGK